MKIQKIVAAACALALGASLALTVGAPAAFAEPVLVPAGVENIVTDAAERQRMIIEVFDAVNAYRAAKGLNPVKYYARGSDRAPSGETLEDMRRVTSSWVSGARWDRSGQGFVQQWSQVPEQEARLSTASVQYLGIGVGFTDSKPDDGTGQFATNASAVFYSTPVIPPTEKLPIEQQRRLVPQETYNDPRDFFAGLPPLEATKKVTDGPPFLDLLKNTYTIPSIEGLDYTVRHERGPIEVVEPGTYSALAGKYVFNAVPRPGYMIYRWYVTHWTYVFPEPVATITPTPPAVDKDNQAFTIPDMAGVTYSVNGAVYRPGTYKDSSIVSIKATAVDRFILAGTTSWTIDLTALNVTATAPTNDPKARTYTIPDTAGVRYFADGKAVTAGAHDATAPAMKITAEPSGPGYRLTGIREWPLRFAVATLQAPAPVFSGAARKYTIPSKPGVQYSVNGKAVTAGTYSGNGTRVSITARAASSLYVLTGTASWGYDFAPSKVAASQPAFNKGSGRYTIPKKTGVSYYVNGSVKSAGTYGAGGRKVTVTAKASSLSYTLTGATSWTYDFRAQVTPATPKFYASANTYVIPAKAGVTYYVNGKYQKAGTYKGTNGKTVTITAKASSSSHKLTGKAKWSSKL